MVDWVLLCAGVVFLLWVSLVLATLANLIEFVVEAGYKLMYAEDLEGDKTE